MFIAILFAIAGLIKKMWDMYIMEYYSVVKKNKIVPFATTGMNLQNITLSEIEKDKYYMISRIFHLL